MDVLIDYARDYFLAESLRIMKLDYKTKSNFDFDLSESKDKIPLPGDSKDKILDDLENQINICLGEFRAYLKQYSILSPETFVEKESQIREFLLVLKNKLVKEISK